VPSFDLASLLLGLVATALAAIVLFAWLARRAAAQRQALERRVLDLSSEIAGARARAEEAAARLADASQARETAEAEVRRLSSAQAALQARAAEQEQAAAEKMQLMEQAEVRLREAFQNLAQQILEDKAQRFREQNAQQLGGLLDPLKVQLKEFRETVQRTWADEQKERGALAQEIHSLRQLNQKIAEDAVNLTRALKGDARSQGAWGELVLERVLELSGLEQGRNYELQVVFKDEDGGRPRPDVIVRLPDSKDLVIDAKVSLTAYERACSSGDGEEREAAIREHVASLRRHIDGLAKRDYASLQGLRTLDFVLLFVPVEAAFIEAVRADDGLYGYALAKNISIVSPSTLLATLRTVAHLWKLEDRNVNAMEIARQAGGLHDSFVLLEQELTQARDLMGRAMNAQEGAIKRLGSGRGNLVGRVEKLRKLGAAARKTLPERVLEIADEDADEPTPLEAPEHL
jgi:DNA recombination protein RmuC